MTNTKQLSRPRPVTLGRGLMLTLAALILMLPILTVSAASSRDAVQTTLETTRQAILNNANRLGNDKALAERLIQERLVPHIDTLATARYVLGPAWRQASETQRERFHEAFTRHAVATYGVLLNRFADEVVTALRGLSLRTETVRQDNQTALVHAFISIEGGDAKRVRVHLHQRNGEWLLFDAEYAGFSVMQIWRAEIHGRLRSQSLAALIDDLRRRHSASDALVPRADQ